MLLISVYIVVTLVLNKKEIKNDSDTDLNKNLFRYKTLYYF